MRPATGRLDYVDMNSPQLRTMFDLDAETYDRTRPVCPAELFDDLLDLAGLEPGGHVLEIGAGTGQATLPLAVRGLSVTAVELGPRLAQVARRRLAGYPDAEVIAGSFEEWIPPERRFDAVLAVNSLHWVDPAVRYAKPAALLRPGGAMAVAATLRAQPADADPFWTDVQEDYRAVGYAGGPPPRPEEIEAAHLPGTASAFFDELATRRYPFRMTYTAADFVANLATQSGTRALGDARAAEFLSRVRTRLAALGMPALTLDFVATLTVGTATT